MKNRKVISFILCSSLCFSICSCSYGKTTPPSEATSQAISEEKTTASTEIATEDDSEATESITTEAILATSNDSTSDLEDDFETLGKVDVNKGVFNVTLTMPKEYMEDVTQEDLDESRKKKGYKSATLNEDGSVTFVMTKEQHNNLIDEIKKSLSDSVDELVTSGEYPAISKIDYNDDFTSYTVTTSNSEPDFSESLMVYILYSYGGMYGVYSGKRAENVHVDFVNEESKEIIASCDSKNLQDDTSETE